MSVVRQTVAYRNRVSVTEALTAVVVVAAVVLRDAKRNSKLRMQINVIIVPINTQ